MTRAQFRDQTTMMRDIFAHEGLVAKGTRAFAEAVRPHDSTLADLYLDVAKANEAIRRHFASIQ
jgi:hypothetical protein